MLLLLISFIAGVLTVLAPCILPLLPVIVGGSLTDGKVNLKKALTIVISLGVSVIVFTLFLKVSTLFINIPEYTWKLISGGIIFILGIITLFPSLWENQFIARLSSKSNILLGKGDQKKNLLGDVIVGAALGPVFSTCSPTYFIVIATVLPVAPAKGFIYLMSYTVGLCLSLLLIAFVGQKVMTRLNIASDSRSVLKRVLGVIFILAGLAILTGYDKKLESAITGAGFFDVTKIEQKLLGNNTSTSTESKVDTSSRESNAPYLTIEEKNKKYKKPPELSSIDGYINTDGEPITLAELKGKVVLLDIWTYSCINCQRTLPYINDWYAKYKDKGLVVIGLHTPEFSFEKVQSNVEKAVQKFNIKYPVVMDNDYSTWNALGNQFWPRKYLIDSDGFIVYDHIGEGNYDLTEEAIQNALKERIYKMGIKENIPTSISNPIGTIGYSESKVESPEVYFGSARNVYMGNGANWPSGLKSFSLPSVYFSNKLYLDGDWNFLEEYAESKSPSQIIFKYNAKNVYMVASSEEGIDLEIYKDNSFLKIVHIKDEQLYNLIEGADYDKHTLKIKIPSKGLKAFTFTFG